MIEIRFPSLPPPGFWLLALWPSLCGRMAMAEVWAGIWVDIQLDCLPHLHAQENYSPPLRRPQHLLSNDPDLGCRDACDGFYSGTNWDLVNAERWACLVAKSGTSWTIVRSLALGRSGWPVVGYWTSFSLPLHVSMCACVMVGIGRHVYATVTSRHWWGNGRQEITKHVWCMVF